MSLNTKMMMVVGWCVRDGVVNAFMCDVVYGGVFDVVCMVVVKVDIRWND